MRSLIDLKPYFHRDCYKFVAPKSGREFVLDINGDPDLTAERQGTFNYYPGDGVVGGTLHFAFDMLPYYVNGNSPEDTTPLLKRIYPPAHNLVFPPTNGSVDK